MGPANINACFLPTDLRGLHPLRSCFHADAVMWAMGATALVSFGLSLFAMQSKVSSSPLASHLLAAVKPSAARSPAAFAVCGNQEKALSSGGACCPGKNYCCDQCICQSS